MGSLFAPKLTHSVHSTAFKVDRGESNRKFLLTESETEEWATAMAKDPNLAAAMARHVVDGRILDAEKHLLANFKDAARALTALGVTEEETAPLRIGDINTAYLEVREDRGICSSNPCRRIKLFQA